MKKKITFFLLFISLIVSLSYLIYTFFSGESVVTNLFNIISAFILFTFSVIFVVFGAKTAMKKETIFIPIGALLLIIFIIFNLLGSLNVINLPTAKKVDNFVSKNISDALKWANANNIEVKQQYEASDAYDEFHIISQNIKEGTLLSKIDTISFIVSSGPDYDKLVIVPSMLGWTTDEVIKFIEDNYMIAVNINYQYSDEEKDIVINQDKSGQVRRNETLTITFSLGKEGELQPTELIDFKDKSLLETTIWLKQHGIMYNTDYAFSDEIKRNNIIKQSIEPGQTVNPNTDIGLVITVSKGKEIIVPDLKNMKMDEITKWIATNKLKISFSDRYNEAPIGDIIDVNYKEGDAIQEGTLITIVISKGALMVPDYKTLNEYREWANKNGVTVDEIYEFNDNITSGGIIKINPTPNTTIDITDHITITVSQGKPLTIPSFVNKTKSQALSLCNSSGLRCTFSYGSYSSSVAKDTVTGQSKKSGAQVLRGSSINLTLSKGTAKTFEFSYAEDWVRSGVADTTISFLKSKFASIYPDVNFTFVKVAHNTLTSGYIHPDSPTNVGATIRQGGTYIVWVIK